MAEVIEPNMGKLLVKLDKDAVKTSGGIFIPHTADTGAVKRAEVIQVGPQRIVDEHLTALSFRAGDKVLLDPLGATKIKIEGEEYLIVRVEDVLARIS